ncbi:phage portal protein, partial [Escherichia coli]|nr:phage portal protein [Escherichia coli]
YDPAMVQSALGETYDESELGTYQDGRVEFHNDRRLTLQNGARMPILYPGEKITTVNAARPYSNFEVFESAVLRNFSSGTGLSPQQVTQDWSDVNYSSARSSLLEAWKTLTRRRDDFSTGFAQPILTAFVEEVHDNEDLPLPTGAPDFV